MEWILKHLQFVIIVVVIIVYVLRAMRGRGESENENPAARGTTMAGGDPAEAERTRQIQEEIRRRILARQRGESPQMPPPLVVSPEEPPVYAPRQDEWREEPEPPPVPVLQTASAYEQPNEAILEQQRAYEEQLRLVRRARDLAGAGIAGLSPQISSGGSGTANTRRASTARRELREDLAHRTSLRRAIMLREILGEPVGLRAGPLPRR